MGQFPERNSLFLNMKRTRGRECVLGQIARFVVTLNWAVGPLAKAAKDKKLGTTKPKKRVTVSDSNVDSRNM